MLIVWWTYFFGNSIFWIKRTTRLAEWSHYITAEMVRCNHKFYAENFFRHTSRSGNCLLASGFPVNFDVRKFKCTINRYRLIPVLILFFDFNIILIFAIFSHSQLPWLGCNDWTNNTLLGQNIFSSAFMWWSNISIPILYSPITRCNMLIWERKYLLPLKRYLEKHEWGNSLIEFSLPQRSNLIVSRGCGK